MKVLTRHHARSAWTTVSVLLLTGLANAAAATDFSVGPMDTFLHVAAADTATPAVIIDLSLLGIAPGQKISVEQLGDLVGVGGGMDDQKSMNAVFSATSSLLAESLLARVPGAIATVDGTPIVTAPTFPLGEPTDIPQDFFVSGSGASNSPAQIVTVPVGAAFLFVGIPDNLYGDNSDPDGDLAVRVLVATNAIPALSTTGLIAFSLFLLGVMYFAIRRRGLSAPA